MGPGTAESPVASGVVLAGAREITLGGVACVASLTDVLLVMGDRRTRVKPRRWHRERPLRGHGGAAPNQGKYAGAGQGTGRSAGRVRFQLREDHAKRHGLAVAGFKVHACSRANSMSCGARKPVL